MGHPDDSKDEQHMIEVRRQQAWKEMLGDSGRRFDADPLAPEPPAALLRDFVIGRLSVEERLYVVGLVLRFRAWAEKALAAYAQEQTERN